MNWLWLIPIVLGGLVALVVAAGVCFYATFEEAVKAVSKIGWREE